MTIAIIVVAAVITILLCTGLTCAAIHLRPTTPCLFDGSAVYTAEARYEAPACSGNPENVYVSSCAATGTLNGMRVCNGHIKYLQDVADQLVRESER